MFGLRSLARFDEEILRRPVYRRSISSLNAVILPFPSLKPMRLADVEDRRRWHPMRSAAPFLFGSYGRPTSITMAPSRKAILGLNAFAGVGFAKAMQPERAYIGVSTPYLPAIVGLNPPNFPSVTSIARQAIICAKRKARREAMFSHKNVGKPQRKRRRRNVATMFNC